MINQKASMKKMKTILYKNNKLLFIGSIILALLTSFFNVCIAVILQSFIDIGIEKGIDDLIRLMSFSLIFITIGSLVGILGIIIQNKYIKRAICNLKDELTKKILNLKVRDFKRNSTGTYISILSNDMTIVEQDYIRGVIIIIAQSFMVLCGLIVMFIISWKLTICVLVACCLPLILSTIFNNKIKQTQSNVSKQNSKYITLIKDIFVGNSVVKSCNIENEIIEIADKKTKELENDKYIYRNFINMFLFLTQTSNILIVIVLFIVGSWLTLNDQMTIGGILAFVQLLNNVTTPISLISENFAKYRASKGLLYNWNEMLEVNINNNNKIEKESFNNKITLNEVNFSFDNNEDYVLRDINFIFEKGKSYAVVGMSGSGKSTLLSLLSGYYDNYSGEIYIDDVEIRDIDEKAIGELISIVQQESFIFDDTIIENIKLFKNWPEERINWVINKVKLNYLFEERDSNKSCKENGQTLSGGEKQRVSIARALLRGVPILLMDEATASLDVKTTHEIEKEISNIEGITKIVVTHKLDSELLKEYDSIIMLKDGLIVESGQYNELLEKKGAFYSLYNLCD